MQNHTPSAPSAPAIAWFSSVTAGYSDSEDRMWLKLVSADREVVIWATRRLLTSLLSQAEQFLKGKDTDEDWIAKHAQAVAPFLDRGGDKPPAKPDSVKDRAQPVGLAHEIQLTRKGDRYLFIFKTGQGPFGVPCSEAESHCLLELIYQRSLTAGWDPRVHWVRQSPTATESPSDL